MNNKYLDADGTAYLISKIKETFATKDEVKAADEAVYTKDEVYTKEEVTAEIETAILNFAKNIGLITDDKLTDIDALFISEEEFQSASIPNEAIEKIFNEESSEEPDQSEENA